MKLKLIMLIAIGALSLGSAAFAQEPQAVDKTSEAAVAAVHRGPSLDRMTDQLNLTPEQKAKVAAYH